MVGGECWRVVESKGCLFSISLYAGGALVLIVSAGLTRSGGGAADHPARWSIASRSLGGHITLMGCIGGVLSAFMKQTSPHGVC